MDALQSDVGFEASIIKFDSNFSTLLLDLLDKLSIYSTNDCEHSMISIIYRYNCSHSYSRSLIAYIMRNKYKECRLYTSTKSPPESLENCIQIW